MSPEQVMTAVSVGVGAAAVGVLAAMLIFRLLRRTFNEPVKVKVISGVETDMDVLRLAAMAEDLLKTSHPEIHVIPTGAEGDMAYRGEIWDSFAEIRCKYLCLTVKDAPVVGIHKVPYWLTNAATADAAWDACEQYLENQVRLAIERDSR